LQRSYGGQWFKGKSLDCSCPLGPWITTRDVIPDPHALTVTCRVNGEDKQRASTRDMIFGIARLVAELSAGMTLVPGDLILTGTPGGIGYTRTPPERLEAGDVVETEIPGLGLLRNVVINGERSGSDGVC
ncbi:MAG: fumarylacetoacetate hydrolase family protein, partial [Geminicoccaceae bacterium]